MKTRIIEINACENCPHFIYGPNTCSQENGSTDDGKPVESRFKIPDWCPLTEAVSDKTPLIAVKSILEEVIPELEDIAEYSRNELRKALIIINKNLK